MVKSLQKREKSKDLLHRKFDQKIKVWPTIVWRDPFIYTLIPFLRDSVAAPTCATRGALEHGRQLRSLPISETDDSRNHILNLSVSWILHRFIRAGVLRCSWLRSVRSTQTKRNRFREMRPESAEFSGLLLACQRDQGELLYPGECD